jgi:hypothetical protein
MSMTAPVYSLPDTSHHDTVDFLRRLSGMMTGGRNAEMLQQAASLIETLSQRAASAERLFHEQQDDHARNVELREAAELASDNLLVEVDSLKVEAESLRAENDLLKTQIEERNRQSGIDRNWFAEETLRAQAHAELAQEQFAAVNAELEELRKPPPPEVIDESIAVVPIDSLRLAHTQFEYLAKGFASSGDVVSQMICEIGARALDKALGDNAPTREAGPPPLPR